VGGVVEALENPSASARMLIRYSRRACVPVRVDRTLQESGEGVEDLEEALNRPHSARRSP
jgi:hypothetical protein